MIELLVVIGIIGVLVAIILPVLHAARERGRTAKCQSNLHQIGLALQQYTTDSNGFLPHEDDDDGQHKDWCWYYLIDPYLETQGIEDVDINEVKLCPGVRPSKEAREESYRMNSKLEEEHDERTFPFRNIDSVARPSVTVCIFDGETGGEQVKHKGRADTEDQKGDGDFSKRHQRGGNILFLDWHVKWYSKQRVDSDSLKNDGQGAIIWYAVIEE